MCGYELDWSGCSWGPVSFLCELGEWVFSFLKWHHLLFLSSCSIVMSRDCLVSVTGPESWSSILGRCIGHDAQKTCAFPSVGRYCLLFPWSGVLHGELIVNQLVKKLLTLHATWGMGWGSILSWKFFTSPLLIISNFLCRVLYYASFLPEIGGQPLVHCPGLYVQHIGQYLSYLEAVSSCTCWECAIQSSETFIWMEKSLK
jgi:hypothetical protein